MKGASSEKQIAERFHCVTEDIARLCSTHGRSPDDVHLVVVTKTHPIESIQAVVAAGARWLGENYVQEAITKITASQIDTSVEWHMIGSIQSRKCEAIAGHFAYVHTLEREKVARKLSEACIAMGKSLPVLLECNVSGEGTKSGLPAWDEHTWPQLAGGLEKWIIQPSLSIRGLMTMAPYDEDDEAARPYFARLRRFAGFLEQRLGIKLAELSMGMSGDYPAAIAEGATILRVGTSIMGERKTTG